MARMACIVIGESDMRDVNMQDQQVVSGGVAAVPGSIVTRALLMGSWTPWTMGVGAFAGGFMVGTYIYEHFDTQIGDAIDAVAN